MIDKILGIILIVFGIVFWHYGNKYLNKPPRI